MHSLNEKIKKMLKQYMQILFVALAFSLMVFISYQFVSDIERKHLQKNVKDAIFNTEAGIKADMLEPETILAGISETIRNMILAGADAGNVQKYIIFMNDYVKSNAEKRLIGVIGFYGFFDVYGGRFIAGEMDWNPPEGYNPQRRPWYIAAVEADGDVGVTHPYLDIKNNLVSITFSRRIFDADKKPLGVVGLDIKIDRIREIAIDTQFAENGYGFLLDQDMELIAHPDPSLLGEQLRNVRSYIAAYEDELREKGHIYEIITTDYRGIKSIVFLERLYNGWYMGIVTPRDIYFKNTRNMAIFLTLLGAVLAVVLIAILITMLRQINKENEKSQAMAHWYNSILNAIPMPITVTDMEAKWTFINSAVEKHLGITLKDAIGKPCSNWKASICNTDNCGIAYARRGFKRTYFSEGDLSYQVDVAILKDLNEKAMGYIEIVQDITSIKLMAKKQEDAEAASQILENILNGLDANIFVNVPDTGEILFVNDYMKKEFKINGDCIGQFCYKILMKDIDGICDFCPCRQLNDDPSKTVVWEIHNPVNDRIYRNTDRFIEWSDGRTVHIQHSVDVTELIEAKEQAIQANKGKSSFLAKVSHEIRTPMNAILGITEIQLRNETLHADIQEALGKIYNSGYLLLGIINDILDLSKIEAGKLELSLNKYDVPSIINDTVSLNVVRYESKPIKFTLCVDENIPVTLFGDELRIKQILNNLLSNAFKYTASGEVTMSVSLEARQEEANRITLVARISDTGQGMTPEQLGKLFDEYARFNLEINRAVEGAGLGMSITKQLVRLMNGEISVESERGKGSVFTVRLPQEVVPDSGLIGSELAKNIGHLHPSSRNAQTKKAPLVYEYMPYGKVLVVDDVETNLYVTKGLLTPYGLSVETATSGIETIKKIKNGGSWDIIFMDHFMPGMDGIEAAKIIRSLGYTNPIVALTANVITGQAEIFFANGFNDFISKPIDIRQLNAVLNKLVRDKYPVETVEAARQLKNNTEKSSSPNLSANPELAKIFTRDAEKAITILETIHKKQDNCTDEDIRSFVINVHAMKSALANIGETELSSAARKLEEAGRKQNITMILEETPSFLYALREVIEKIKPDKDVDYEAADNIGNDDHVYLSEKLTAIQKACAEYDKKTAKDALASLRQKTWSQQITELLETISEHLLHSEFAEAANLIEHSKKTDANTYSI